MSFKICAEEDLLLNLLGVYFLLLKSYHKMITNKTPTREPELLINKEGCEHLMKHVTLVNPQRFFDKMANSPWVQMQTINGNKQLKCNMDNNININLYHQLYIYFSGRYHV